MDTFIRLPPTAPTTVQYASDLHYEFDDGDAPDALAVAALPVPCAPVLVLAGDVATTGDKLRHVFAAAAVRWVAVLYVAGNHEAYGKTVAKSIDMARAAAASLANVHVLEHASVVLEWGADPHPVRVRVAGCTLWTDIPPSLHDVARSALSDYTKIGAFVLTDRGAQWRRLQPSDTSAMHADSVAWLHATLDASGEPVLVVSHHLPTTAAIADRWRGEPTNCGFATELPRAVRAHPRLLGWIAGHTHERIVAPLGADDGAVAKRVYVNPRGYPHERGRNGYDPTARVGFFVRAGRVCIVQSCGPTPPPAAAAGRHHMQAGSNSLGEDTGESATAAAAAEEVTVRVAAEALAGADAAADLVWV